MRLSSLVKFGLNRYPRSFKSLWFVLHLPSCFEPCSVAGEAVYLSLIKDI